MKLGDKLALVIAAMLIGCIFSCRHFYLKGLVDGKENYRHSKAFQMTLDSAYRYGSDDGLRAGYTFGYTDALNKCRSKETR